MKPGFVVSFVFLILQVGSSLRLYGLVECRSITYFLCLLSVICFVCGTTLANKTKTFTKSEDHYKVGYEVNYLLSYGAIIASILIMLPFAKNMISSLQSMGLDALLAFRESATSDEGLLFQNTSSLSYFLYDLIVQPLCYTMPAVVAIDFTRGRKDKFLLIGAIILIVFKTLFTLNRATLFYALIIFMFIYFANGGKLNISFTQKILIAVIATGVLFAIYYITSIRATMTLQKSIYKYIAGVLPNLDLRLDTVSTSGLWTMGFASLRGVFNKAWSILKAIDPIGIFNYPNWYYRLGEILNVEAPVIIGDGLRMNAFVTPIYAMYIDAREFGVAIGMFIYGYFSQKMYLKFRTIHNAKYDALYSIIWLGLVFSFIRMQFSNNAYAYGVIFCYFLIRKSNGMHNREEINGIGIKTS